MNKKYLYLIINLIITFAGFGFLVKSGFRFEAGQFAYPLDDSFIHLAMAKNIALEGVWGVTSHEFSSTSSSPLFTLILAGLIKVFGNIHTLPLYLNAVILFVFTYYLHIKSFLSDKGHLGGVIGLLVTIIALPSNLAAMGMEHILQLLTVIILVTHIHNNDFYKTSSPNNDIKLFLYTFLAVSTRFESVFIIGALCAIFLLNKDYKKIIIPSIVAFLPIIIYGIYSKVNGSGYLPNSLLIKSHTGENILFTLINLSKAFYKNFFDGESMGIFLLLPLLFQYVWRPWEINQDSEDKRNYLLLTFFAIALIIFHYFFARVGWLYRYENYTLMIAIIALFPSLVVLLKKNFNLSWINQFDRKLVTISILLLLIVPFIFRFQHSLKHNYDAQRDIYTQHILISRFIRDEIKPNLNGRIAINDIGAICYYSDVPIVDIWGLATYDIVENKHSEPKEYLPKLFEKYDVNIAVYYPDHFENYFEKWVTAAKWDIGTNRIAAGAVVNFDGISREVASDISNRLENFKPSIPKNLGIEITTF